MVNGYVALIQELLRQNWSRPPSAQKGMRVTLKIRLTPTGEVVSIKVDGQGSGNVAFDESAIRAVQKISPIRELSQLNSRLFEQNFRELTLEFNPQDL